MGKKRVIKKTVEELLREREGVEEAVRRAGAAVPQKGFRFPAGTAIVHVRASYNNVILSLSDSGGNILIWVSSGSLGFHGAKKATPFAASRVAEALSERAKSLGITRVSVLMKGIGSGRESAIRSLATHGMDIVSIKDVTPIPHNGPRPPKPRRV